jgi:hypothetical protein
MRLSFLAPKRPAWFRGASVIAAALLAIYLVWSTLEPWTPGRLGGLIFGGAAAFVFVLDALYPLRRRLMAWPLATAQQWLQFHLYGGVLACLCVAIHVGFRLPGGAMGWWLIGLTLWATVSGLAGIGLQKYVPAVLANELRVEAIYERIPELAARLQPEADALVVGAPEVLQRFYATTIRDDLDRLTPSWAYLAGFRAELAHRIAPFHGLAAFLSETDRVCLSSLEAIVTEKLELEVQYSLQRLLRQWAVFHVVPCIVLLALLTIHIVAAIVF